ncbi:MAG: type VI secretion protein IcmF/TssM N-terminal domain-containing protein [Desulfobacterales bacterium]
MKKIAVFFAAVAAAVALMLYFRNSLFSTGRLLEGFATVNALAIIVILIIINVSVIVYLFHANQKKVRVPEPSVVPEDSLRGIPEDRDRRTSFSARTLKKSFADAITTLKRRVSEADYRYSIPWYLLLGEADSGTTTALHQSGLHLPAGSPFSGLHAGESVEKQPCNWWFFERGIVLDIAGDIFLRTDLRSMDRYTSDSRMWQTLIRLLQKYRPKRPIDGLVLTIPCTDLLPPESPDSGDASAMLHSLTIKADLIHKKLWHLQKELGIRFPVYIMVSKCNSIKGFSSFCKEIPPALAGNIFGWSNPYPFDRIYSSDWVREAFEQIGTELLRIQYELFAEGAEPQNRDSLFLLPGNFQAVSASLQICLDHIFAPTAYHEMFILRGIYFIGEEGFFVKDLFDGKIFPESGIARPLTRTFLSRNRRVIAFQTAAALISLLLFAGLLRDSTRLARNTGELKKFVEKISDNAQRLEKFVSRLNDSPGQGTKLKTLSGAELYAILQDSTESQVFTGAAEQLIKGLSEVSSLKHPFIPASFFSEIHEKNEKAMALAYNIFILKGMYLRLVQKTSLMFDRLKQSGPSARAGKYEVLFIEEFPEFVQLKAFAEDFRELETYSSLYFNLDKSRNLRELGRTIQYLYDINLSEDFYQSGNYYQKALGEARFADKISPIFNFYHRTVTLPKFRELYEKIFLSNALLLHLQTLSLQLKNFGEKSRSSAYDEELIRDVLKTIAQTRTMLQRAELKWIFSEHLNFTEAFDNLLKSYAELKSFEPGFLQLLEKERKENFRELRENLALQESVLTGPLLKREGGEIVNELSPAALALRSDLERLLEQKFMVMEKAQKYDVMIPAGMRIFWNISVLNEAVQLFRPYEEFMKIGLKNFPKELRNSVQNVARSNLEKSLLDKVGQAIRTEPLPLETAGYFQGSDVSAEIKNFKEAAKLLNALLLYSRHLDLTDLHWILSDILYAQPIRLLKIVDEYLSRENLYNARGTDFSWWDGQSPLSLAAFDVADEEELKHYLKLQRERVAHLSFEYAEPVVSFLSASNIAKNRKEERLYLKWNRILAELDKYENKEPENTLTALEKFILFDMGSTRVENYFEKIAQADVDVQSGDIFLQKRNELRRKIFWRCKELSADVTIAKYNAVKDLFDEKLAGRFPFSGLGDSDHVPEVSPEDIRDFYRVFDREVPDILAAIGKEGKFGISAQHTAEFLGQMKTVRQFFEHFLNPAVPVPAPSAQSPEQSKNAIPEAADGTVDRGKLSDIPVFAFDIGFRANQGAEIMGNRIIEWRFTCGDQVIRYGDEKTGGYWKPGSPVTLSLRWARNGMDYPVFAGKFGQTDSEARTVSYLFANQWALLRFLRTFADSSAQTVPGSDVRKDHLLAFQINAERLGEDLQIADRYLTKVFLRVALEVPGKPGQILLMPSFPDRAPALTAETQK